MILKKTIKDASEPFMLLLFVVDDAPLNSHCRYNADEHGTFLFNTDEECTVNGAPSGPKASWGLIIVCGKYLLR